MPHNQIVIKGSFLPVPITFDGTPDGLSNALKVEIIPTTSVIHESEGKTKQTFDMTVVTNRALIDFSAVHAPDIDFEKLKRDCELMIDALSKHPGEIKQALDLVCRGDATTESIESTAAALDKAGLTEKAFRENGGGWIGLVVAAIACMLTSSCAHVKDAIKKDKPPTSASDGE